MPKKTTNPEETPQETTPKFTEALKSVGMVLLMALMQPNSLTVDEPEKTPNKRKNQATTEPKNYEIYARAGKVHHTACDSRASPPTTNLRADFTNLRTGLPAYSNLATLRPESPPSGNILIAVSRVLSDYSHRGLPFFYTHRPPSANPTTRRNNRTCSR